MASIRPLGRFRRALTVGPPLPRRTPLFRRTLVQAPRPNSGPLLSRRSDRELPSVSSYGQWIRTLPIFVVIITGAALGIFNYQKSSSSVVTSTLYALRRSAEARELLGDQIYFAHRIPWISGEMNQLHGRIDISFWVKGTRGTGKMRFKSTRESRMGYVSSPQVMLGRQWKAGRESTDCLLENYFQFRTEDWSLEMEDGRVIQLLEESKNDPLSGSDSISRDELNGAPASV